MDSDILELLKNENLINLEQVFYSALEAGKLQIAQRIFQINPNVMKNHNSMETTFRYVCGRLCRLDIAQWMLQVSKERGQEINISFNNEEEFRSACEAGRIDIAQWLQSLKPDLYEIEYDENGKYIGYKIRGKKYDLL